MADEAKKDLEQELRERLEKEMQERQVAREQEAPQPPNAASSNNSDARSALEKQIERELEEQLNQAASSPQPAPTPPSADDDLTKQLEAELQAELEARMTSSTPEAPKPEAPKPEAPKPEAPKPEAPKQTDASADDGTPTDDSPQEGDTKSSDQNVAGVSVKVVDPADGEAKPAKPATDQKGPSDKRKSKRRSNPNRKTNRRPKKVANGLRPRQKTSNTRNLSDQEQMLLQEKAKIDAKFKKQQRVMYVAITVGTLLAAGIILPLAFKLRGCIYSSGDTQEVSHKKNITKLPEHITGGSSYRRPRPVEKLDPINTVGELDRKVREELKTYNYQKAVDYLEKFSHEQPDHKATCDAKIKEIAEDYIAKSAGSRYWQQQQDRITQGMYSNDPADVRSVISGLKRFARSNSKERFVANYYVNLMTKRHVEMTGGILPY